MKDEFYIKNEVILKDPVLVEREKNDLVKSPNTGSIKITKCEDKTVISENDIRLEDNEKVDRE